MIIFWLTCLVGHPRTSAPEPTLFHIYNNGYLRQMCLSPTSGAAGLLTGSVTNSTDSVQLYNGNEFDHSLKLALYNYGARHIFSKLILIPA